MFSYLHKSFGMSLLAVVAAGAAILTFTHTEAALADNNGCDTVECRQEVAAARAGTANYHNFDVALADGFTQISPCVRRPGVGTMGFHFGNASRVDQTVDPSEPEVLLFLPDDEGEMHLVAVEYIVPKTGTNLVPTLFGRPFQFSAARNQYELHAWIWKHNPLGMFENFNPRLNCPGF